MTRNSEIQPQGKLLLPCPSPPTASGKISPDKEKTRLPRISDLADSAQIERDADLIGLLHRDRSQNDGRDSKLIIAKQRDGEIGTCEMNFESRFASFENRET